MTALNQPIYEIFIIMFSTLSARNQSNNQTVNDTEKFVYVYVPKMFTR